MFEEQKLMFHQSSLKQNQALLSDRERSAEHLLHLLQAGNSQTLSRANPFWKQRSLIQAQLCSHCHDLPPMKSRAWRFLYKKPLQSLYLIPSDLKIPNLHFKTKLHRLRYFTFMCWDEKDKISSNELLILSKIGKASKNLHEFGMEDYRVPELFEEEEEKDKNINFQDIHVTFLKQNCSKNIQSLKIDGFKPNMLKLANNQSLSCLQHLYLSLDAIDKKVMKLLAETKVWKNLQQLGLPCNNIGPDEAENLSLNAAWLNLQGLDLNNNAIGPEGTRKLMKNGA